MMLHRSSDVNNGTVKWGVVGVQSIAISVSVCLFVCLTVRSHISKTTWPNFTKFSVYFTGGRDSVLHRRKCNMLCTSILVDDVTFSHNGANGPESKMKRTFHRVCQVAAPGRSCYRRLRLVVFVPGTQVIAPMVAKRIRYFSVIRWCRRRAACDFLFTLTVVNHGFISLGCRLYVPSRTLRSTSSANLYVHRTNLHFVHARFKLQLQQSGILSLLVFVCLKP